MYYLLIDLYHFSQYSQLEKESAADLLKTISSTCNRWGLHRHPEFDGLLYYHPNLGPGEYEPLLKVLFALNEHLKSIEEDSAGYSLILEASDRNDSFLGDITGLRYRTRERQGMYLGPNAEKLISRFLVGESFRGLWKIISRKQKDDEDLGTATEFTLRKKILEAIFDALEPWMNGEAVPGAVCVSGSEMDGIHLVGRGIAQRLVTSESQGKLPYVVINEEDDLFSVLANSVAITGLGWTDAHLSSLERRVWREKKYILASVHPRILRESARYDILSEQFEIDMMIALQMYLRAYSRWSRDNGNSPLAVLLFRRALTRDELRFLHQIMEEAKKESRIFWLISGEQQFLPEDELPVERIDFQLEDYRSEEIAELAASYSGDSAPSNPGYIESSTEGKALTLYQFLGDYEYFSEMLPSRLRSYGNTILEPREGIIQRYLDRMDFETRELLFTLSLVGDYLDKEQIFSFMESRGRLRIRITQMYKDLQTRGLLFFEQINAVPFQAALERLGYSLGDVKSSLITDLIEFIMAEENQVNLSSGIMRFLSTYARDARSTRRLYRRLQLYIESRQYDRAEQLSGLLRNMKDGRSAERLMLCRIDIVRNNFRPELLDPESYSSDFWKAEVNLLLAMQNIRDRDFNSARQQTKQAIILFQNISDAYGLSISNIFFGYLLHREKKFQDATHYYSIGERSAQSGQRDPSKIYAEFLPTLSDFAEGKLSRVRSIMEGDSGLVSRLSINGCHSWSAAAGFILSRTYFAMGLYQECTALLGNMLNTLHGENYMDIRRMFYAWMGRSLNYKGEFQAGMRILENLPDTLETQVFKAESLVLQGDYENALEELKELHQPADSNYQISVLLPWSSGFSWIEDLFVENLGEDSVLINYAIALRSYSLGNVGDIDMSIEQFHWLTREKKIPESDPHSSVILYWYSGILEQANDSEKEDRLTLLGRAVKALQERSSRIEEPADKREFLKNVLWNSELLEKAKRFNLV